MTNRIMLNTVLSLLLALLVPLAGFVAPAYAEAPTAAAATQQPASGELPEDVEALAAVLTAQLYAGEYADTVARLDAAIAAQLRAEALAAAIKQVTMMAGDFTKVLGTAREDTPQGIVVDVYVQHTGRPMRVRLVFNDQSRITGLWIQPVTAEEVAARFPQEETPASAETRGQEIPVTVGEYALPGLLTVPNGERLPITVLLVAGSGPNDRDSTVGAGNKPLRDLAMGLAEKGISTLRYDKRSMARPDTLAATPTIQAEVLDDAAAGIALLQEHAETKGHAVFVAGHSLGGMLAPAMLQDNPALAGAVILAGTPRTLFDVIHDQSVAMMDEMSFGSDAEKKASLAQSAAMRDQANAITKDGDAILFGMPQAYIASLNNLKLADTAKALTRPMLILQGGKDVQVSAQVDYKAWQDLLLGHGNAQFRLYPELNHLLMASATGTLADYAQPGTVAQEVIDDIAAWLTETANQK